MGKQERPANNEKQYLSKLQCHNSTEYYHDYREPQQKHANETQIANEITIKDE